MPDDDLMRDAEWSRLALLQLLARLLEQIRLKRAFPPDPWEATQPGVRRLSK